MLFSKLHYFMAPCLVKADVEDKFKICCQSAETFIDKLEKLYCQSAETLSLNFLNAD